MTKIETARSNVDVAWKIAGRAAKLLKVTIILINIASFGRVCVIDSLCCTCGLWCWYVN